RTQLPEMPEPQTVTFAIEGLGRGTVAMLRSHSGPKHPGMLSWFSHGYQDEHPVAIETRRRYGFAVPYGINMSRILATAQVFASLPDAFASSGIAPTTDAPGAYVAPHSASELTPEIDRLTGLVGYCDVAVLLDFRWAGQVDGK